MACSVAAYGTSRDVKCLCEYLITCIASARRRPGITWKPQHRAVMLKRGCVPLERPGLNRLVQQAQSDARVPSWQAFEPWNVTSRISLLERKQRVAVHEF